MANAKRKTRPTAPARKPAAKAVSTTPAHKDGHSHKFITRTIQTIVTIPTKPIRLAAGPQLITIRTRDPGESVPCIFDIGGSCTTGGRGITVTLSYLDPATMTTSVLATAATTCVGGHWSVTFDMTGSGLSAGTELFVDAQIDRLDPSDPLVSAYLNLFTAHDCPIIAM
jgi:hypothetical protein